jgi:flagellar hook-length control protein FliK
MMNVMTVKNTPPVEGKSREGLRRVSEEGGFSDWLKAEDVSSDGKHSAESLKERSNEKMTDTDETDRSMRRDLRKDSHEARRGATRKDQHEASEPVEMQDENMDKADEIHFGTVVSAMARGIEGVLSEMDPKTIVGILPTGLRSESSRMLTRSEGNPVGMAVSEILAAAERSPAQLISDDAGEAMEASANPAIQSGTAQVVTTAEASGWPMVSLDNDNSSEEWIQAMNQGIPEADLDPAHRLVTSDVAIGSLSEGLSTRTALSSQTPSEAFLEAQQNTTTSTTVSDTLSGTPSLLEPANGEMTGMAAVEEQNDEVPDVLMTESGDGNVDGIVRAEGIVVRRNDHGQVLSIDREARVDGNAFSDFARSAFADAMVESIDYLNTRKDNASVVIRLDPKEYGNLKISLTQSADGMQAVIRTDDAALRTLMSDHLGDLRQRFQDQGLSLDDVRILYAETGRDNAFSDRPNNGRSSQDAPSPGRKDPEALFPAFVRPTVTQAGNDGRLNILA